MTLTELIDEIYPAEQHTRKPDVYHDIYESILESYKSKDIKLLELGVHTGHSLALWHRYLPRSEIVGLDIRPEPEGLPANRVSYVRGRQDDPDAISRTARHGPFDIIIDDASHIGTLTKKSFEMLFYDHLKNGGLYIIEDIAASVHFPNWPDHRPLESQSVIDGTFNSYQAGMIGFLKQVMDQVATSRGPVETMAIYQSMAVLRKRKGPA